MEKIDKNLITLREASELTGYSSDYIGQLIRSGKIPGKQVYTNITWITTAQAVKSYKKNKKNRSKEPRSGIGSFLLNKKNRFSFEVSLMRLFFQTFKSSLPALLLAFVSFVLLIIFSLYFVLDSSPKTERNGTQKIVEDQLSF